MNLPEGLQCCLLPCEWVVWVIIRRAARFHAEGYAVGMWQLVNKCRLRGPWVVLIYCQALSKILHDKLFSNTIVHNSFCKNLFKCLVQTKVLIQCVCLLIFAFKHLRKSPEEEELEYYEMPLKYGVNERLHGYVLSLSPLLVFGWHFSEIRV